MGYRTLLLPKGEVRVWDPETPGDDCRAGHTTWEPWLSSQGLAKRARYASMDAKAVAAAAKKAIAEWEGDSVTGRVHRLMHQTHEYRQWVQRRYEVAVCRYAAKLASGGEASGEEADVSHWAERRDRMDDQWMAAVNTVELLLSRPALNALLDELFARE